MKILFIADIVGQPGRRVVQALVPKLRSERALDLVIANGENSAGGSGITPKTAGEIFVAGVDVITSGDHLWDQKEVMDLLEKEERFLRPLNYPEGTPGHGSYVATARNGAKVAVMSLQGRTFMPPLDNPFTVALSEVQNLRRTTPVIFLDFHAEATSEKMAMGRMLDGRISALIGTHTHVQTADERIFPGGMAFMCDGGFTGPHDGVIGRDSDAIVRRFLTSMPQRFDIANNEVLLQGAIVDVDAETGRAFSIERVSEKLPV